VSSNYGRPADLGRPVTMGDPLANRGASMRPAPVSQRPAPTRLAPTPTGGGPAVPASFGGLPPPLIPLSVFLFYLLF